MSCNNNYFSGYSCSKQQHSFCFYFSLMIFYHFEFQLSSDDKDVEIVGIESPSNPDIVAPKSTEV